MDRLDQHVLKNGMVILGEAMEAVQSVAFDFMMPAGSACLPAGVCGASNVFCDWVFRGAGTRDNRQLSDSLDGLGLQRSTSVSSSHVTLGAKLEASNLGQALELFADIILRPHLDPGQFDLARQLAVEEVKSLDDEPRQKVMVALKEQFYPSPLGRSTCGHIPDLEALTAEAAAALVRGSFAAPEIILSVAGKYDFDQACRQMEGLFGGSEGRGPQPAKVGAVGSRYTHLANEGAQVHIGLMTTTAKPTEEDYYNARVAISVLSGGMSARLFTEVREKRGLCYAVGSRYHGLKDAAGIMTYAGTSPDKAQETFDVIVDQFRHLQDGVSDEELARAKVGLKSSLILQSESSGSRAGSLGGDYYMLGRVRSLDEIKQRIEATTADSIVDFLKRHPFKEFTVVTIGPKDIRC
jgi:predicted Zn-dependent peptidase